LPVYRVSSIKPSTRRSTPRCWSSNLATLFAWSLLPRYLLTVWVFLRQCEFDWRVQGLLFLIWIEPGGGSVPFLLD
jgi:hypothetical protein